MDVTNCLHPHLAVLPAFVDPSDYNWHSLLEPKNFGLNVRHGFEAPIVVTGRRKPNYGWPDFSLVTTSQMPGGTPSSFTNPEVTGWNTEPSAKVISSGLSPMFASLFVRHARRSAE